MLGEGNYYLGIIAEQLLYTILIEEIHYEEKKVFTQRNEILDVFPEFDFKIVSNDETTKYFAFVNKNLTPSLINF
jgi:hypothetical protein